MSRERLTPHTPPKSLPTRMLGRIVTSLRHDIDLTTVSQRLGMVSRNPLDAPYVSLASIKATNYFHKHCLLIPDTDPLDVLLGNLVVETKANAGRRPYLDVYTELSARDQETVRLEQQWLNELAQVNDEVPKPILRLAKVQIGDVDQFYKNSSEILNSVKDVFGPIAASRSFVLDPIEFWVAN